MSKTKTFHDVVRERYSARTYRADPVPGDVIHAVLDDAQRSPSNANIQPWDVHIVSGAARDRVSEALLAAEAEGRMTPDYPFGYDELYGAYSDRQVRQADQYYKSIGVAREATDDRRMALLRNLEFFGAPHACFLFLPPFYDSVRIASDVGMYGQTFLLSLTAHGLQGCPQTLLGFFAGTIREVLGVDPKLKMLFGISFGYPDLESQGASYRIDRAPIEENVTLHS
ncbi:nitroreductase [Sphingopyxis bauzanensis]|uniref:Nitroreductase n=1 Tax=Sphingopyxis bauzanensis TaxID=651663 RepID=A0A246JR46_9SPHN|nr:nitroreductase [Sphingopyxis bauzanensis]OWQ95449.1 nitroreductase [Sphingopyxis bauzanensis]